MESKNHAILDTTVLMETPSAIYAQQAMSVLEEEHLSHALMDNILIMVSHHALHAHSDSPALAESSQHA